MGLCLIFSPDSKHFAYVAWQKVVCRSRWRGKEYDGIVEGSLIFSPDSKHLAYVAVRGKRWFVVVDGKEGKEYDGIAKGTPVFSPKVVCRSRW